MKQGLIFVVIILLASVSKSQILAWDFNKDSGNEYSVLPTFINTNLNVSAIKRGSGLSAHKSSGTFAADSFLTSITSEAGAVAVNDFIYFEMNCTAGYKISLTTLDANFKRSPAGPVNFIWQYSIDGITYTDIGSSFIYNDSTKKGDAQSQIILSGITALQDVPSADTITIRLVAWGATNTGGTFAFGKPTSPANDISVGGSVFSGAHSSATDYFRSAASGNWSSPLTWQSSSDNTNWTDATLSPTNDAKNIIIQSPDSVTLDVPSTANALMINSGGTLIHNNGISLELANGAGSDSSGTDFIVDGTYEINGSIPRLDNGATVEIRNGGIVKVNSNTGGQSDNFAQSNSVLFKTGSVFQWNIGTTFGTKGVTYFPSSTNEKPVFKITKGVVVGADNNTTINGKLEVSAGATATFKSSGAKIFRDGFGGTGTVIHDTACGQFQVTGSNPVIDGSITINIKNNLSATNDFEISAGSDLTISGSPVINIGTSSDTKADFEIDGTLKHNGSNPVDLSYGNLILNGNIDTNSTGTFTTSAVYTNIFVGGSAGGNAGLVSFTGSSSSVDSFSVNRNNGKIILGSNLSAENIILTKGIIITGNHLFMWNNNGGILSAPNMPWTSGNTNYSDSYICTCTSTGDAVSFALPYTETFGFKIKNISGSSDYYFPVGADLNSANRMMINMNNSATADFTAAVTKGDIGNTPLPRINRIWYVNSTASNTQASVKLFFTKRDWTSWPNSEDEVEAGFDYGDIHLIQKDYTGKFVNVANGSDVSSGLPAGSTEIYAAYSKGVSADSLSVTNGITNFSRFSVVNATGIILPVNIINFKAYRQNKNINLEWTSVAETNTEEYEIDKSSDGTMFQPIGKITSLKNTGGSVLYHFTDTHPDNGNNFYRIKTINSNKTIRYTNIVMVNFEDADSEIKIFPNPVTKHFFILQLNNISANHYQIQLFDISGKMILNKIIKQEENSSSQKINLPQKISAGIYCVRIINGINKINKMLIVQ